MKKNIYVFHPFRQHNFEQADALNKHFSERVFLITSLFFPFWIINWFPVKFIRERLSSRSIRCFNLKNVKMIFWPFLLLKLRLLTLDEYRMRFINHCCRVIKDQSIIIGFDGNSKIVFERFKGRAFLILDTTIALQHYSLVVNPDVYNKTVNLNEESLAGDYFKDKVRELNIADLILVGSAFVRDSITHFYPELTKKIEILPYGFEPQKWKNLQVRKFDSQKLRLIFVGTVSFRKGFDLIIKLIERDPDFFEKYDFRICGRIHVEFETFVRGNARIKSIGFLSHEQLLKELNFAHILILPSYLEGSAITVYQAMATGLPCLVSSHVGSVITDGEDGLICSAGDISGFSEKLNLVFKNRNILKSMSVKAEKKVSEYTWQRYGEKLSEIIQINCG